VRGARTKLLLLTDELEVGGTQRQIVAMACGLPRERYDVHVAFFRNESYLIDRLRDAGVPVTCIPKRRGLDPTFLRSLVRFLRARRFDVVHAFALSAEFWSAVAQCTLRDGVLLTSVRNRYDWYSALQWRAKAFASWRSRLVVANSAGGASHAARHGGVDAAKVRLVYNGVDLAGRDGIDRAEARRALGLGPDEFVAVCVGRLVEQKNVPCLLRAFEELVRGAEGTEARLLMVGDGPLRDALTRLAHERGIGGLVSWLGERSDVMNCLAAADVAVQSSNYEGLSNSLLEAMAGRRPVVATAVGGTPEIVRDGVTGILVPPDDAGAIARAMSLLRRDSALAVRMGTAGRARVESEFSLAAMLARMDSVYREARGLLQHEAVG
jgi:glycosyltransferase involved in cell wall biosynthesis